MSGQIKTEEQIYKTPISGNETYVAQWKINHQYTVRFNGNGGIPGVMTRKYAYEEQIGYFPTFDEYPDNVTGVSSWKLANGN